MDEVAHNRITFNDTWNIYTFIIEEIGYYDPMQHPAVIKVDNDKAADWMKKGAQPTDTVRILLKKSGAIEG